MTSITVANRTLDVANAIDRGAIRAAVEDGRLTREPVSAAIVCAMLDIDADDLNAMYTNQSVNGVLGVTVAGALCNRYGLDELEPLGAQLAAAGILTDAEGAWLDDQD